MKNKVVFNWSGGKDSALALYKILQEQEYEVVALLTTVNRDNRRFTMHAIPVSLLEKQADSLGIPLYIVNLMSNGLIGDYEKAMSEAVSHLKEQGVTHFVFGDIFLHDVKSYREEKLNPLGITVVEPLWGKSSEETMNDFLASGLQTIVVTTMADILDESFIGRHIDRNFVKDLPEGTDVCGENGEYNTFCYSGSIFRYPVAYTLDRPFRKIYPVKMDDGTKKDFSYWFAGLYDAMK